MTLALEEKLEKLARYEKEGFENIGLINRISKVYQGLKYEILVYSDNIVWKVADSKFTWNNKARIWNGESEFDFNTFGVKNLHQI